MTRKLQANWTFELPEDMQFWEKLVKPKKIPQNEEEEKEAVWEALSTPVQPPFNPEDELRDILAAEIQQEIDKQIIEDMKKAMGK